MPQPTRPGRSVAASPRAPPQSIADRVSGGAALAQWAEDPLVCVSLSAPGAGLLAAIELRAESCAVSGGR